MIVPKNIRTPSDPTTSIVQSAVWGTYSSRTWNWLGK